MYFLFYVVPVYKSSQMEANIKIQVCSGYILKYKFVQDTFLVYTDNYSQKFSRLHCSPIKCKTICCQYVIKKVFFSLAFLLQAFHYLHKQYTLINYFYVTIKNKMTLRMQDVRLSVKIVTSKHLQVKYHKSQKAQFIVLYMQADTEGGPTFLV